MADNTLKLAVVGCGAIFERNHLAALVNSSYWEIAFLVDNDESLLKGYASKLKCGYSDSIKDIPASVNACLIATPNFLHAKQSIELLKRGFHVICEKPMTLNLAEAMEVKHVIEESGTQYFIVHQKRFQKNIEYFKNNYLAGATIFDIDISLGGIFNWVSKTDFYKSPEKAGGGVMLDIGVHLLDILISFWSTVSINRVEMSTPVITNPVIDSAVTCFGTVADNIPFIMRASRTAGLNNSFRINTNKGAFEIALGNSFQIGISAFEAGSSRKIELQIGGGQEDTLYPYWDSVAAGINGTKLPRNINPTMIEDGIAIMKCIETTSSIANVIRI